MLPFPLQVAKVQFRRAGAAEIAEAREIRDSGSNNDRSGNVQLMNGLSVGMVVTLASLSASFSDAQEIATPTLESVPADAAKSENLGSKTRDGDSELDTILRDWERVAAKRCRVDARFQRWQYDHVFGVEFRCTGRLAVDTKGRADYEVVPTELDPQQTSKRIGIDGRHFTLRRDRAERWHWTGNSVILIDKAERTYEEIVPPRELTEIALSASSMSFQESMASFTEFYLAQFHLASPYLLGMPVEDLKGRYRIELVKRTDNDVWLRFVPRSKKEAANFREAIFIMNAEDYSPVAVRIVDASGNKETVHVFSDVRVTRDGQNGFVPSNRLERPDLRRHRPVLAR